MQLSVAPKIKIEIETPREMSNYHMAGHELDVIFSIFFLLWPNFIALLSTTSHSILFLNQKNSSNSRRRRCRNTPASTTKPIVQHFLIMHSNRLNRFKREAFAAVQCTVMEIISHFVPFALITCALHTNHHRGMEMNVMVRLFYYCMCARAQQSITAV